MNLRELVARTGEIRRATGIPQTELAERMSSSQNVVSSIEYRQHPNPMIDTLIRYFDGLGVTVEVTVTTKDGQVFS